MKNKLPEQMQSYVAESCIGASALRGQGGSGLIEASRKFFKNLDLSTIPTMRTEFDVWLNKRTAQLLKQFPKHARHFGAARKAMNLFLRSAAYNIVLNRAHHLDRLLPVLELPLDSFAAKHLADRQTTPYRLPKWSGLKRLLKPDHQKYQEAAQALSRTWKVHRVDLDVFFFREEVGST